MEIFFAWVILSFFVAILGKGRKIGFGGTLVISLLLSPILGVIFALASERKTDTKGMYKCPYCAEYVKNEAKLCKHCGSTLEEETPIDIENFRKY